MVRGGFMNHKVSSLEGPLGIVCLFIRQVFIEHLLYARHMLDNGDQTDSSTLGMRATSDQLHLVNCHPPSTETSLVSELTISL